MRDLERRTLVVLSTAQVFAAAGSRRLATG
jgi:hypothetical protein